ncbi:MAG: hypothetical protein JWN01_934 [Patescibacteria group bacterium]|nr:hypothetical protein [Patescibacteria group bacterium]
MPRWLKRKLRVFAVILAVMLAFTLHAVVYGALYLHFKATHDASLQHGSGKRSGFAQSVSDIRSIQQREKRDPAVRPECRSQLWLHGTRVPANQAVVMFHGYSNCPEEFSALAKSFYDRGFNVYVPKAPYHGLTDRLAHAHVTAQGLVAYADQAVTLGSGLGKEVGVAGLSGGGVLATWSALYRADVVRRALILSPFYEPSASQTSKMVVPFFLVLYGYGIAPDKFNPDQLSYHALAQYVRIAQNFGGHHPQPPLLSAGMVLSAGDQVIDQDLARSVATLVSPHSLIFVPPPAWGLGHDIVDPKGKDTNGHAADLYPDYLLLYGGLLPK